MASENPEAFPRPAANGWAAQNGMTLRDWFAGQAVSGLLASPFEEAASTAAKAARQAYQVADAMLAARQEGAA